MSVFSSLQINMKFLNYTQANKNVFQKKYKNISLQSNYILYLPH